MHGAEKSIYEMTLIPEKKYSRERYATKTEGNGPCDWKEEHTVEKGQQTHRHLRIDGGRIQRGQLQRRREFETRNAQHHQPKAEMDAARHLQTSDIRFWTTSRRPEFNSKLHKAMEHVQQHEMVITWRGGGDRD